MIEYRVMTIEDYDGVYSVWENTPEMSINSTDDSREGIEKYLKRNPATSFVAVDDGKIVGLCLAGHDGRRGYIAHMAVLREYKHRKIGTRLVECTMKAMEEEGIPKVALLAYKKNDEGNAFWESVGFGNRTDLNYRNKSIQELVYRPDPFREV